MLPKGHGLSLDLEKVSGKPPPLPPIEKIDQVRVEMITIKYLLNDIDLGHNRSFSWAFTGSYALYLWAKKFEGLTARVPHDIDIVVRGRLRTSGSELGPDPWERACTVIGDCIAFEMYDEGSPKSGSIFKSTSHGYGIDVLMFSVGDGSEWKDPTIIEGFPVCPLAVLMNHLMRPRAGGKKDQRKADIKLIKKMMYHYALFGRGPEIEF